MSQVRFLKQHIVNRAVVVSLFIVVIVAMAASNTNIAFAKDGDALLEHIHTVIKDSPASSADEPTVAYTIIVREDHGPAIGVGMTIFAPTNALGADGTGMSMDIELPEGVSSGDLIINASGDADVHVRALSPRIVNVEFDAPSVTIAYEMRLRTGLQNPATQPGAPYTSVSLGEFAYIAGRDTLPHPSIGFSEGIHSHVAVGLPPGSDWTVFAVNRGAIASGEMVTVANPKELVLLLGPLSIAHQDTRLTLVTAGEMPWDATVAAESIHAMLASLETRGLGDYISHTTVIHIRYPGALRLNPLVSGHIIPDGTIIHWIGTGSLDWWRKYAARDIVGLLLNATVTVAPEATWFVAGLPEYAGLLLLHDTGYMTDDELYGALRTLYTTGVHYSGPGWPSLVLAGVSSPRSHASQRVLEFRAPLVALLLDAEIRGASEGSASLLDVWLAAADEQRRNPYMIFSTAALLPARADFGDLSSFAEDFLFGNRIPPVDFDAVYRRWLGTSR